MTSLHTATSIALAGYVCIFLGAVVYLATFPVSSNLVVYAQVNLLLWAINAGIFLYGLQCAVTGGCNHYAWIIGTAVFLVGVFYLLTSLFKFTDKEQTIENRRKHRSPGAKDELAITDQGWPTGGITVPRL